jgi:hypothetical protein
MDTRLGIFCLASASVIIGIALGFHGTAIASSTQGHGVANVHDFEYSVSPLECQVCLPVDRSATLDHYAPPSTGPGSGTPGSTEGSGTR